MHDITKLKPIHQKMYGEFTQYTNRPVPDELYNTWLTLAGIPERDWGKQSTVDAVQEANN